MEDIGTSIGNYEISNTPEPLDDTSSSNNITAVMAIFTDSVALQLYVL